MMTKVSSSSILLELVGSSPARLLLDFVLLLQLHQLCKGQNPHHQVREGKAEPWDDNETKTWGFWLTDNV